MPSRHILTIVIHCSASANGVLLARPDRPGVAAKTAAMVIDGWHQARHFLRDAAAAARFNPHLKHVGYHYVIDVDGTIESARHEDERGAHVQGRNYNSLGVCVVGTDSFTVNQWQALRLKCIDLLQKHPKARLCGHRDLSPDLDRDGTVEPHEWLKTCPGFDVTEWWLQRSLKPMDQHIFKGQ